MTNLNNWYNRNLASYEEKYIDTGAGFCSDRNTASGDNYTDSDFSYAPSNRLNKGANLQCNGEDILSQDNGKLPNPIGLLTSDEYVLAGKGNYINTDIYFWTMSPYVFSGNIAMVLVIGGDGYFYVGANANVSSGNFGVRPVINLKSTVALEGDGSVNTPFKIVGT